MAAPPDVATYSRIHTHVLLTRAAAECEGHGWWTEAESFCRLLGMPTPRSHSMSYKCSLLHAFPCMRSQSILLSCRCCHTLYTMAGSRPSALSVLLLISVATSGKFANWTARPIRVNATEWVSWCAQDLWTR
jgi:hypothetical protein